MKRLEKLLAGILMVGLCAWLGFTAPAFAQSGATDEVWQVLEIYGSVRYRAPGASGWSKAVSGTELPPGTRLVTDANGWVLLRRDGGNFWVEPDARFVLPSPDAPRVRQEAGDLHYRIIRNEQQRFEVETPYASLVVKGTAFDVRVADAGMAVEVARGWVEVTTPQGARADLRAGQAARVRGVEPTLEVQPAPGRAFEPVPPDLQVTPAVQPRNAVATAPNTEAATSAPKGWWQRVLDGLRGTPEADATAGGGSDGSNNAAAGSAGAGGSGGSAGSGDGSGAGAGSGSDGGTSGSSGSSGGGSSGSADSGGSSGSSGGTSGSSSAGSGSSSASSGGSSGSSGGSASSSSGSGGSSGGRSGGGLSVGVGIGGISAGVSVGGGGIGAGVGIGGKGLGVGIGR